MISNQAVPRNDRSVDIGVVFYLGLGNYAAIRQSDPFSYFAVRTHCNIRTDFAIRANCRCVVDKNITIFVLRMSVDVVIVEESSLGFDVICWFANVKPKVILYWQGVKLAFLGHMRINFSLYHTESLGYSF